jgi:O-antigen ligase
LLGVGVLNRGNLWAAWALFLVATLATVLISLRDPLIEVAISVPLLLLGSLACLRGWPSVPTGGLLAAIPLFGCLQLALGGTADPWATRIAIVRLAALSAAAVCTHVVLKSAHVRLQFLRAFTWLGFAVSVVGVLAYYTSPGLILWLYPSPYPDTWGPFLSRNNFAQFLELALPVALWLAIRERSPRYAVVAAAIFAAGLASASRAGAALLTAECVVVWLLLRRDRPRLRILGWFAATAASLAVLAGASTLLDRLSTTDPFEYRREIAQSTLAMIREHPWRGSGLGTFASAYPAHATFDAGRVVEHAHNDWLEFAAEGGWPYAALWIVLALGMARAAIRSVWGIGVLAVCLHALVDYPFARLGIALWVFVFLGAMETIRSPEPLRFSHQENNL